jgi:hypothetical protein
MNFLLRKKATKRSPLKEKPLRIPGQSLQEEIDRRVDKTLEYVVLMALAVMVAMMEWLRWFFNSHPQPIIFTVLAILVCSYGIWKVLPIWRHLKPLKQGRDGERFVGQRLENLRESGYRVLHDIVTDKGNIDHVVIGPTGVYTVETKTISKPVKGPCEIAYDGQAVSVNGYPANPQPIDQAKAEADWIKEKILKKVIPGDLLVRPVVLYPEWYVSERKGCEVWVLNLDRFLGYLKNEKPALDKRDIQAIEGCLSVYVRNSELK